jgi:hypothetical protein
MKIIDQIGLTSEAYKSMKISRKVLTVLQKCETVNNKNKVLEM